MEQNAIIAGTEGKRILEQNLQQKSPDTVPLKTTFLVVLFSGHLFPLPVSLQCSAGSGRIRSFIILKRHKNSFHFQQNLFVDD
jgi:hypothetical protein